MVPVNKEAKNGSNYVWFENSHIKSIYEPKASADWVPVNGEESK